jgi:hypothetical protein
MKWLLRAVGVLAFVLFVAIMEHNEMNLLRERPHVARPELGYTVAIATKGNYGFGPVETIYISWDDNVRRIELLLLWVGGIVVSGFLLRRKWT